MPRNILGNNNPNWKGGLLVKFCEICRKEYSVKLAHKKSKYCSLVCVGISQRGIQKKENKKVSELKCEHCEKLFIVPSSHAHRYKACSKNCSYKLKSKSVSGVNNPNWCGGISRLPYPWNFKEISRNIIFKFNGICQNPSCNGHDKRMTTHHINYIKSDCREENLIALCSSCNSRANFGRQKWMAFYQSLKAKSKKDGGGWEYENF